MGIITTLRVKMAFDPSAWMDFSFGDPDLFPDGSSKERGIPLHNRGDIERFETKPCKFLENERPFNKDQCVMPTAQPSIVPQGIEVEFPTWGFHPVGFVCKCGHKEEDLLIDTIDVSIKASEPKSSDAYIAVSLDSPSILPPTYKSACICCSSHLLPVQDDHNKASTMLSSCSVDVLVEDDVVGMGDSNDASFLQCLICVIYPFIYLSIIFHFPGLVCTASLLVDGVPSWGQSFASYLESSSRTSTCSTAGFTLRYLASSIASQPIKIFAL